MFRRGVVALGLALQLAACSDNDVSGEVAGVGIEAVESIAFSETTEVERRDGGKDHLSALTIVLTNVEGMCGRLSRNVEPPNARVLAFGLSKVSETGPAPIGPGEYPFIKDRPSSGGSAEAFEAALKSGALIGGMLTVTDAQCGASLDETKATVTDGKVVVDSIDAERVAGTFELSFPGGDKLTGRFDAPFCSFTKASGPATCETK